MRSIKRSSRYPDCRAQVRNTSKLCHSGQTLIPLLRILRNQTNADPRIGEACCSTSDTNAIYAVRALSTAVEPSHAEGSRKSALDLSKDDVPKPLFLCRIYSERGHTAGRPASAGPYGKAIADVPQRSACRNGHRSSPSSSDSSAAIGDPHAHVGHPSSSIHLAVIRQIHPQSGSVQTTFRIRVPCFFVALLCFSSACGYGPISSVIVRSRDFKFSPATVSVIFPSRPIARAHIANEPLCPASKPTAQ